MGCAKLVKPVPLRVVGNSNRKFLETVEQRGMFPSAQLRLPGLKQWEFKKEYEAVFRSGGTYMCGPSASTARGRPLRCSETLSGSLGSFHQ